MWPNRLPVTNGGETPSLSVVGHSSHQHSEQSARLIALTCTQAQLHQQAPALQPWTPAWKVKGQIKGFRLAPLAGLGIIAPWLQIGRRSGVMTTDQRDRRRQHLGLLNTSN